MSPAITAYMATHPEAWDSIKRATYAYQNPDLPGAHRFKGDWTEAECIDCVRSRWQVRWDEGEPPECCGPASARLHRFSGAAPWAKCRYCEEPRERAKGPVCHRWVADPDIGAIIRAEEERFERLWDRAVKLTSTLDLSTLTGEQLSTLHHTHGIDPSMIESALIAANRGTLAEALHAAYEVAYEAHCSIGDGTYHAPVLVAKTA